MNQILNPPNEYNAGLEFDYSVWNANTEITLVNVPWNSDYRDVVKFDSQAALDAYIDNRETTQTKLKTNYARTGMPIKLSIPFAAAYRFNYIRVRNPAQPITGDVARSYYYFVQDIRHLSPGATEFQVQLDVFQSFGREIEVGKSFVERGHIGIANEDNFDNFGRTYLTVPEGMDTGGEYQVIRHRWEQIWTANGASDKISILVASTVDLLAPPGTEDDANMIAAQGGTFSTLPSGSTYYLFETPNSFTTYLNSIRNFPWVSQGIISVTAIPNVARYWPGFTFQPSGTPTTAPPQAPRALAHTLSEAWRDEIKLFLPSEYRHLNKFLTFPYMVLELTTFSATPIMVKPESWNDADATIVEMANVIPPTQRIIFMPYKYNALTSGSTPNGDDDGGEFLDFHTLVQAFPTFAIVNNNASMFMAMNGNSIAFQNQSADWSQQKALSGNQMNYDQTSRNIDLMERLGVNSRNADIMQTGIANRQAADSAIFNGVAGVASGAGMGGIGGPAGAAIGGIGSMGSAIVGNINTMRQIDAANQSLAVRDSAAAYATGESAGVGRENRDSNKALSDYAARGDYANQIAGINAKVQDSRMAQPSISGQIGGDTFNLVHGQGRVSLRWKMLDRAHIASIGDYWLRYGYAVSRFTDIPSSLMVMTKFTYWKLSETYFYSATVPEAFKQAYRGMFEKGVTVWRNPDDIGRIDWSDNEPLEGIKL